MDTRYSFLCLQSELHNVRFSLNLDKKCISDCTMKLKVAVKAVLNKNGHFTDIYSFNL